MNSHTVSEAKNHKFLYPSKKTDENTHNRPEMWNTGLQYGVDIDVMLRASTIHKYDNMEYSNENHYPSINGKMSTSNN